ncbi:hypothetical protein ACI8AF_10020 [Blastococcus sp. SYSU D00669]
MTTTVPPVSTRVFGRAAMSRADVPDAKRGHPAVDLRGWAADRGLQHVGSGNASGYFAALPLDAGLQFNVCRGTSGDRDVCVWHWRYPWPVGDDLEMGAGTWFGVHVNVPMGHFLSVRRFISSTEADNVYVGVPCTGAASLTPEAALLPSFVVHNRPVGWWRTKEEVDLAPYGLRGFTLQVAGRLPDGVLDRLVRSAAAAVLREGGRFPLFELRYRLGTVVLKRSGYASTAAELDELVHMVRDAGAALAEACRPLHRPQPFEQPLPAAAGPGSPMHPWVPPTLAAAVQALGGQPEDPAAYAAAFPTNPVPGTPWAVLRGGLPGLPATARLALHSEAPLADSNSGRTALLLPAGAAAPTPPGGLPLDSPSDPMRYAVRDGILAVWVLRWRPLELGDVDGLLRRGTALARQVGALPG